MLPSRQGFGHAGCFQEPVGVQGAGFRAQGLPTNEFYRVRCAVGGLGVGIGGLGVGFRGSG